MRTYKNWLAKWMTLKWLLNKIKNHSPLDVYDGIVKAHIRDAERFGFIKNGPPSLFPWTLTDRAKEFLK